MRASSGPLPLGVVAGIVAMSCVLALGCGGSSGPVDAAPDVGDVGVDAPPPDAWSPPIVHFSITPPGIVFEPVPVGMRGPVHELTVRNFGTIPTRVLGLGLTAVPTTSLVEVELVASTCAGRSLAPGETCTVSVRFAPRTPGAHGAQLRVADDTTFAEASLMGETSGVWTAVVTPPDLHFGEVAVGAESPHASVEVSNLDAAPVGPMTQTLGGADPGSFRLVSDTCGGSLGGYTRCTSFVSFAPARGGAIDAVLDVDVGGVVGTVTVHGVGVESPTDAVVTVVPNAFDYGQWPVGGDRWQTFVVANTGRVPSSVITIDLSGGDSQLRLARDDCDGVVLAAGTTCELAVAFRPTDTLVHDAVLTVGGRAAGPLSVALTGTGFM